jgi:hypothetical protein
MREFVIIMPKAKPDRQNPDGLGVHYLRTNLLKYFGGYTEEDVRGAWLDPTGTIHRDHSIRFTVAVRPHQVLRGVLGGLAKRAGELAGQQCVYVRNPNGLVHFLTLDPEPVYVDFLA